MLRKRWLTVIHLLSFDLQVAKSGKVDRLLTMPLLALGLMAVGAIASPAARWQPLSFIGERLSPRDRSPRQSSILKKDRFADRGFLIDLPGNPQPHWGTPEEITLKVSPSHVEWLN